MSDLQLPKFPVSTLLSFIAAVIAVVAASAAVISDPRVITQTLIARTFVDIFSVKVVYLLFFWVYFCAVYVSCLLYERYHSNTLGEATLVCVNYQFTIWIWLPTVFII